MKISSLTNCIACNICANICPVNAITMHPNKNGFLYPLINVSICIKCGLCETHCIALEQYAKRNEEFDVYAAIASDEIRAKSSSGGLFSVIAEYILSLGGVVYGAAFDKEFRVIHKCVTDSTDMQCLRGSKYVQSDILNTICEAQQMIKDGKIVLFSGTPCQTAATRRFIGNTDKLVTFDFLCHGVPSPKIFQQHIAEVSKTRNVKSIEFRNKKHGWTANYIDIEFLGGECDTLDIKNDPLQMSFHRYKFIRPSCECCNYAEFPHASDITGGDFWGIKQHFPELDDGKGTSVCVPNTPLGYAVLAAVKSKFKILKKVPSTIVGGRRHYHSVKNKNYDRFFYLASKYSISKSIDYINNNKHDIGMVGWWRSGNYGSALTCYCLYVLLKCIGYEILVLSQPTSIHYDANPRAWGFHHPPYHAWDICPLYEDEQTMFFEVNKRCDTFVVGSDQVWRYSAYLENKGHFFLDFAQQSKKKISIASSFAVDYWGKTNPSSKDNQNDISLVKSLLQKFSAISVREQSGVNVALNYFGLKAQQILDPVFLVPSSIFDDLAKRAKLRNQNKLFAYILRPSIDKLQIMKELSVMLNIEPDVYGDGNRRDASNFPDWWDIKVNTEAKVEDWLYAAMHSTFIIADSFHATCFAIIFNKPFLVLSNEVGGITRLESVLSLFSLEDRMVSSLSVLRGKEIDLLNVDYLPINSKLDTLKRESIDWIKKHLSSPSPQDAFQVAAEERMQFLYDKLVSIKK